MLSDIEIAQATQMARINEVAATLGIPDEALVPYGHYKAKVSTAFLDGLPERPGSHLILVTAISPTPAGEGKTTTTVGLGDGLRRIGKDAMICLREPSLGPVFGMKGGAAGGGYAQVVPMEDINLHFTGDFSAIGLANNLLSALIDNHIHHGNALGIDVRRITWKRVVDMNDRALRDIVVGLGGPANGYPREDGFDIVVASEVMAIFCLAISLDDLRARLGNIIIGYTREKEPIRARDLNADGAMTVLLKDAFQPNLVQTLEHTPAFVHGGPFANIAHGCNTVIATAGAMKLADYVVTEAGFGADLGAEKFIDIKCRKSGLRPSAAVIVATIRALKYHGGADLKTITDEDLGALEKGVVNLRRHIENVRDVYGVPCIVSINNFTSDTVAEVDLLRRLVADAGAQVVLATHWADGGAGTEEGHLRLPRRGDPVGEDRGHRHPCLPRRRGDRELQGPHATSGVAGHGLRPPSRVHRQDAVLLLHRCRPAWSAQWTCPGRARGASVRRSRIRRGGLRGHHDNARSTQGAISRTNRPRRWLCRGTLLT